MGSTCELRDASACFQSCWGRIQIVSSPREEFIDDRIQGNRRKRTSVSLRCEHTRDSEMVAPREYEPRNLKGKLIDPSVKRVDDGTRFLPNPFPPNDPGFLQLSIHRVCDRSGEWIGLCQRLSKYFMPQTFLAIAIPHTNLRHHLGQVLDPITFDSILR